MFIRNWRHDYSDHPEDFDFWGNPWSDATLARRKEKDRAEESLREMIEIARTHPEQFGRLLNHFHRRGKR
jgi:hypothetical protein